MPMVKVEKSKRRMNAERKRSKDKQEVSILTLSKLILLMKLQHSIQ